MTPQFTQSQSESLIVPADQVQWGHSIGQHLSLCPMRLPSILRRMHGKNGQKCGLLMYPDHSRNDSILPVLAQFCPSGVQKILVKLEFPGILRGRYGRSGLKCVMLMYPEHLQKFFDFSKYWSNFGPLVAWKVNARNEWSEILHADVSWPPPEVVQFWSVLA